MTQEMDTQQISSGHDQVEAICHDLRQHLATGMLLAQAPENEDLRDSVRLRFAVLKQQLEYAADLVAILSADAGPRPGRGRGRADLATLATQCVEASRSAHDVALQLHGPDHAVGGDPVLLRRAIANLLDNACRAATSAGHVLVQVGGNQLDRWVEVADNGPGFGEIRSGTGVGLSVVRAAVQAGNGRLEIASEGGTRIRMTFPAPQRVLG
jgi:signal transduction histidine kinase